MASHPDDDPELRAPSWLKEEVVDERAPQELFVGGFLIYRKLEAENSDASCHWLGYYKTLCALAFEQGFYELRDFQATISFKDIASAVDRIKEYMIDNLRAFSETKGLVSMCFEHLGMQAQMVGKIAIARRLH